MTCDIKDKFYNGMKVKLRCGGILEGVMMVDGSPELDAGWDDNVVYWHESGLFAEDHPHPFDIVEVLR